jgi:hypothetical protein
MNYHTSSLLTVLRTHVINFNGRRYVSSHICLVELVLTDIRLTNQISLFQFPKTFALNTMGRRKWTVRLVRHSALAGIYRYLFTHIPTQCEKGICRLVFWVLSGSSVAKTEQWLATLSSFQCAPTPAFYLGCL